MEKQGKINIRKLIRETLMSEGRQYADGDIINHNEIDLYDEYDKLNKLLFNGQLQAVTMIWNKRKSAHGVVRAKKEVFWGKWEIKSLGMSQFLNITYKNFKDVLAHEMIHVYLLQQNINDGHGWRFQREMNRINGMGLGFNVTITANFDEAEINSKFIEKAPTLIAVVMDMDSKHNLINTMTPAMYERTHVDIERMFQGTIDRGKYRFVNITYIKSNDPELMRFPTKKKAVASITYRPSTQEYVDKLKSTGEIINTIQLKRS